MPHASDGRPSGRILVADDEPHIRRILRTLLENDSFVVHEAADGQEALDLLQDEEPYDFVLLDLMMPGASGIEVLRAMSELAHRVDTPVIMLTAKGQDTDREAALAAGANDFLTKPFSPKKLLARIHELLAEGR